MTSTSRARRRAKRSSKTFDEVREAGDARRRRVRGADRPRQLRRQGARSSTFRGPTSPPADFNAQFKNLPTRQIVFVDTTSASGPFVDELSAPGRTIITATRNGAEITRRSSAATSSMR